MAYGKKKHLLLLDRSQLAENILKFLLADSPVTVTRLRQENLEIFLRKHPVDACVINSNFIEQDRTAFFQTFAQTPQLAQMPKIFLCREDEQDLKQLLEKLAQSVVALRPFHPLEFKHLLSGVFSHD